MKYFIIRLLSIPLFVVLFFVAIFEIVSIILTMGLALLFYEWLFKIDYFDYNIATNILWKKLTKLGNG